jgi:hypothetical protein
MIVIFNGPPGTGKDEACSWMQSNYGFVHLSFKYELFKAAISHFGVSKEWFMDGYNNRNVKEQKEDALGGMSRREAMIHVSEDVIKPKYGSDYFGVQAASQINGIDDYCFSDGGFVHELIPIINKSGVGKICIVQLTRDGCDFSSDSRRYFDGEMVEQFIIGKETKISKIHLLPHKFPIRTYRIHNNGTVEQFKTVLDIIYEKERYVQ